MGDSKSTMTDAQRSTGFLQTALILAKSLAFLAFAVFFAIASFAALEARKAAAAGEAKASAAMADERARINAVLTAIIDPKTGTIHLINKDAVDAGDLIKQAHVLTFQEQKAAEAWNAQIGATFANANAVLLSLRGTSDTTGRSEAELARQAVQTFAAAQTSIQGLQPVLASVNTEVVALQSVTKHLDVVAADPAIPQAIGHVNDMTADVQQAVHSYLHPKWPGRVYHVCLDVAHALNPL